MFLRTDSNTTPKHPGIQTPGTSLATTGLTSFAFLCLMGGELTTGEGRPRAGNSPGIAIHEVPYAIRGAACRVFKGLASFHSVIRQGRGILDERVDVGILFAVPACCLCCPVPR